MHLKGTNGLYRWSELYDDSYIYIQDLEKIRQFHPNGKVFQCIDENLDYITLKFGNDIFRVKPELYKVINKKVLPIGSVVKLKKYPDMDAIIIDNRWHGEKKEPMYFITLMGKKKSIRYFLEDFIVDEL